MKKMAENNNNPDNRDLTAEESSRWVEPEALERDLLEAFLIRERRREYASHGASINGPIVEIYNEGSCI